MLIGSAVGSSGDKDAFGDPLPEGAKLRLGTTQFRTRLGALFYRNAISQDGSLVAAVSDESSIVLLDRRSGNEVKRIVVEGHRYFEQYRFVRKQELIGFWSDAGFALLETNTGKKLFETTSDLDGRPLVDISEDGNWVAEVRVPRKRDKIKVGIWSGKTNKLLGEFSPLQDELVYTSFSEDGKTLATWGYQSSSRDEPKVKTSRVAQVWNVEDQREKARVQCNSEVKSAALSPDGKLIAISTAWTPGFELFNALDGKSIQQFAGSLQTCGLKFSPDGNLLVVLNEEDGAAQIWDIAKRVRLRIVQSQIKKAHGLVFTSNENAIVWGNTGRSLAMWEIPSGKILTPVNVHTDTIRSIRFSNNGKSIFTGANDGRWIEWDRMGGTTIRNVPVRLPERFQFHGPREFEGKIFPVAFVPDDKHLVMWPKPDPISSGLIREAIILEKDTGLEIMSAKMVGERDYGEEPIFSADGSRMIVPPRRGYDANNEQTVPIWDVKSGAKVSEIVLPEGDSTASFTPNGIRLVTATLKNTWLPGLESIVISGWDIRTGRQLSQMPFPKLNKPESTRVHRWPHCGVRIAAANNSSAVIISPTKLWRVNFEFGKQEMQIDTFPDNHVTPSPIAFNPDRTQFAVGVPIPIEGKYGLCVYETQRGTKLHTFVGHLAPISALTFSPDGQFLASGSDDTSVLVWDLGKIKP